MCFASLLLHYLKLDKAEKIRSLATNRTFSYDCGKDGRCTISLRRFLRLLRLSRIMVEVFGTAPQCLFC